MKVLLYGAYVFFSAVSKFFEHLAILFNKAADLLKPKNALEWGILIIAIILPFGLTAYILYKYFSSKKTTQ
jgi:hypothetical protein